MTARIATNPFATTFMVCSLLLASCTLLVGCSVGEKTSDESAAILLGDTLAVAQDAPSQEDDAKKAETPNPVVTIKTSYGEIKAELFENDAPISVRNFLAYVEDGHYEGTIFHRVIDGFMIQGGGFTKSLKEKDTRRPIKNESDNGVPNKKYTLAMARTSDPNSATDQFYINVADNKGLDREFCQDGVGYAVFGRVVSGMEVVDKIAKVQTVRKSRSFMDFPKEMILIEKVTIDEVKPAEAKKSEASENESAVDAAEADGDKAE